MKRISLIIVASLIITANYFQPAKADSYKGFDENIVRAYKTAKIKTIKPNLSFPEDAEEQAIDSGIDNYLIQSNYFAKNLRNKPGIFFVEIKKVANKDASGNTIGFIKVDRVYCLKNPEKFMFALNNKLSKKELTDREFIANNIQDDASIYAILSEKIDVKNSPLALKALNAGYNGFLDLFIMVPKIGFGYIINPPFYWLKTDTATDIYKHISSELEDVSIGDKDQLKVKYYKN